jgi:preprotein translocase subunit SecB
MLSAIQIKQHVFTHIEVVCDPDCLKAPENESYEVTLSATEPTRETNDAPWKMNVDVRFGPSDKAQPVRYRGHLTVIGFFDVHASFAEDKRLDLVRMNGGSLLIGSIREMVLTLTSRSARGPFELPTFDVRMFLKQPEAPKLTAT